MLEELLVSVEGLADVEPLLPHLLGHLVLNLKQLFLGGLTRVIIEFGIRGADRGRG